MLLTLRVLVTGERRSEQAVMEAYAVRRATSLDRTHTRRGRPDLRRDQAAVIRTDAMVRSTRARPPRPTKQRQ
jgi:hypothetical protein